MKQHAMAWLSKSRQVNFLTALTLAIWFLILLGSIFPLDLANEAGKRDLIEATLEVGEIFSRSSPLQLRTIFGGWSHLR